MSSVLSGTPTVARLAAHARHGHCPTASVAFSERADLDRLLRGTPLEPAFGQSPFAFSRGTRFEALVKDDKGDGHCSYAPLLALLRDELGFKATEVATINLRALHPGRNRRAMAERARETRRLLAEIASGDPAAANFIDGAVFERAVGGRIAYYEADGIAFRVGDQLHVLEIKSFPIVDDQAWDPQALASALDQGAMYILLVREILADLGHDPETVSTALALVCPRNVGLSPCLHVKETRQRMERIAQLLAAVPDQAAVRAGHPGLDAAAVLERIGDEDRDPDERLADLDSLCATVGTEFGPACDGCGLSRYCRSRAFDAAAVELLDSAAGRELVGVPNLTRAAALAAGMPPSPPEAPAAAELVRVAALRDQARTRAMPA
jgi:hypothetical protein